MVQAMRPSWETMLGDTCPSVTAGVGRQGLSPEEKALLYPVLDTSTWPVAPSAQPTRDVETLFPIPPNAALFRVANRVQNLQAPQ